MVNKLEEEPRKYTDKDMLENWRKGYRACEEIYSAIVRDLKDKIRRKNDKYKN